MNKYRKYINFVIDDLVSQTKRQGMFFNPPYINEAFVFEVIYQDTVTDLIRPYSSISNNYMKFRSYCREKYAIEYKDSWHLWGEYVEAVNDRLGFHIRIN
jgi:hypothetical protein